LIEGEYWTIWNKNISRSGNKYMCLNGEPWMVPQGHEPGSLAAMKKRRRFEEAMEVFKEYLNG
jgi:hypothetical protein